MRRRTDWLRPLPLLLSVCSCQTPARGPDAAPADAAPPALHAVHHEKLAEIMKDLQRMEHESLPQELGAPADRRQRAARLAEVAAEMARSAAHIPDVLAEVRLHEEDRQVFRAFAEELRSRSRELQRQAEQGRVGEWSASQAAIAATCTGCHTAFRIMPAVDRKRREAPR